MQPTHPPPGEPTPDAATPDGAAASAQAEVVTTPEPDRADAPPGTESDAPVVAAETPGAATPPTAPPTIALPPTVAEPSAPEPGPATPPGAPVMTPAPDVLTRLSGALPQVPPTAPVGAYPGGAPGIEAEPTTAVTIRRRPILAVLGLVIVATVAAALVAALGYVGRSLATKDQLSFAIFTLDGLRYWLPALAVAAVVGALVLLVAGRRAFPGLPPATAWPFPFAAVLAGTLLLSIYHDRAWWYVAPIVTWALLLLGTIARVFLREPSGAGRDVARTVLTIVTYVVAFLALAMIYINKLRSIYSATAVALVAVLLLLQMTDGETAPLPRRLVYAIAGGIIIGQVTWVINYWSAAGWTGGAFLLAVFYLIAGLTAAQLRDRIGPFDVVEFGGIALLALAIVSVAVLYQT